MDALAAKRKALGHHLRDNWGGSSSNDGGSSTSDSGSGEGSTGGGGYSLGGISPSPSQAGGGGYQEEYQPADNPAPPAPPVADQYAAYGLGKQAADLATGTGTGTAFSPSWAGLNFQKSTDADRFTVTNNPASLASQLGIGLRAVLSAATGGFLSLASMFARGEFSKLEKPSWAHQMDGASDAYWDNNTPTEARTWGGNGAPVEAYAAGPAKAANHMLPTSRLTPTAPATYAAPGFSLFPGNLRPNTLTQTAPGYLQSTPTTQDDGLTLAVLAGLAVLAFS